MIEFNRRETMAKESNKVDSVYELDNTHVIVKLKDGSVYLQRLYTQTLSDDSLTTSEKVILELYYATQQKESVVHPAQIWIDQQRANKIERDKSVVSDEEIRDEATFQLLENSITTPTDFFIKGAKWMRNKLTTKED